MKIVKQKQVSHHMLNHRDLAEALVKGLGIREGEWQVCVEFGPVGAATANIRDGAGREAVHPAAMLPVVRIGLLRCPEPTPISVSAAEINGQVVLATPGARVN